MNISLGARGALKDRDLRVIVGYNSKSIPIEGKYSMTIKGLGKGVERK